MTHRFSSLVRGAAIALGAASVALVGVAAPASATTQGTDTATIDTYTGWDGVSVLHPFGNPQTSTYGQVITVPAGKKKIKTFTYYMATADEASGSGTIKFRGEIYGWDGTKATTPVFESKAQTLDITLGNPDFRAVKINAKRKAKVTAGQQYVLFLSISKDYEDNPSGVLAKWACNYADVLPGGYTVYQNDDGDESQWTSTAWSQIDSFDLAMKARLR
jgi:hypothetical protein